MEAGFDYCEAFGKVVAEGDVAVVDCFQTALQTDVVAAVGAAEQWVAGEAGGGGGERLAGEGVDAVVGAVFAGFEEPVEDVLAVVSAGRFGAGRDGQVFFTTGGRAGLGVVILPMVLCRPRIRACVVLDM